MNPAHEPYLAPYHRAAERHGGGFDALLWASPRTQEVRFDAIRRAYDPTGKSVLDVGCGRADYLEFLYGRRKLPSSYIGIEGVEALADAAEAKRFANYRIVRADFVRHPARLFVGAQIVVFSGSLNTLDDATFYATLRHAYHAAGEALVFNFLASWNLAGRDYLHWRKKQAVQTFAGELCADARMIDDYIEGDCTVCLVKAS